MLPIRVGGGGYSPLPRYELYEYIDYDYPEGFDWDPNGELHKRITALILERAHEARAAVSARVPLWRSMDMKLKAYVRPEVIEKMRKAQEREEKMPCLVEEERIVFPYTYSMLEGLLTYLTSAFIQDPIFQYEGVEGDDVIGAALMELVVQVHCNKSKAALAIHTALRDALAYGYGVAIPSWRRQIGMEVIRTATPGERIFIPDQLLYEGNALDTISPYMVLPDPNVSSVGIQDGEFFGWLERTNYMRLATAENETESEYFNVRYLRQVQQGQSALAWDYSVDNAPGARGRYTSGNAANPIDVIKMYVTLIPAEWELSENEYPEKWYFELANDSVIIRAHPAAHAHGMYPVAVASPEFDGYDAFPVGRMEILNGLQDTLDFLFHSHIMNVRKGVNNRWIVDPQRINIHDLMDNSAGGIVRTRRDIWTGGISDAIQQMPVNDVTRNNIGDSQYITGWMDRISGADAAMQGFLRQGGPERLTAKEFLGTQNQAHGRLARLAQSISMQFMQDIGKMFAIHTKQFMNDATYVKLVGRHGERLQQHFYGAVTHRVMPDELNIDYDLLMRDGSLPGGQGAQVMMQLFDILAGVPELAMQFDVPRIFSYIATQFGVKNVDDFRRQLQPQTMPDEQVEAEAQAGNLLPLQGVA